MFVDEWGVICVLGGGCGWLATSCNFRVFLVSWVKGLRGSNFGVEIITGWTECRRYSHWLQHYYCQQRFRNKMNLACYFICLFKLRNKNNKNWFTQSVCSRKEREIAAVGRKATAYPKTKNREVKWNSSSGLEWLFKIFFFPKEKWLFFGFWIKSQVFLHVNDVNIEMTFDWYYEGKPPLWSTYNIKSPCFIFLLLFFLLEFHNLIIDGIILDNARDYWVLSSPL